jgi:hypothetical protein
MSSNLLVQFGWNITSRVGEGEYACKRPKSWMSGTNTMLSRWICFEFLPNKIKLQKSHHGCNPKSLNLGYGCMVHPKQSNPQVTFEARNSGKGRSGLGGDCTCSGHCGRAHASAPSLSPHQPRCGSQPGDTTSGVRGGGPSMGVVVMFGGLRHLLGPIQNTAP